MPSVMMVRPTDNEVAYVAVNDEESLRFSYTLRQRGYRVRGDALDRADGLGRAAMASVDEFVKLLDYKIKRAGDPKPFEQMRLLLQPYAPVREQFESLEQPRYPSEDVREAMGEYRQAHSGETPTLKVLLDMLKWKGRPSQRNRTQ